MLHTKFCRNRPVGSLKEDPGKKIFKVFTIYVHGSHLGHVTSIMLIKWLKMAQWFLRKASFNLHV